MKKVQKILFRFIKSSFELFIGMNNRPRDTPEGHTCFFVSLQEMFSVFEL